MRTFDSPIKSIAYVSGTLTHNASAFTVQNVVDSLNVLVTFANGETLTCFLDYLFDNGSFQVNGCGAENLFCTMTGTDYLTDSGSISFGFRYRVQGRPAEYIGDATFNVSVLRAVDLEIDDIIVVNEGDFFKYNLVVNLVLSDNTKILLEDTDFEVSYNGETFNRKHFDYCVNLLVKLTGETDYHNPKIIVTKTKTLQVLNMDFEIMFKDHIDRVEQLSSISTVVNYISTTNTNFDDIARNYLNIYIVGETEPLSIRISNMIGDYGFVSVDDNSFNGEEVSYSYNTLSLKYVRCVGETGNEFAGLANIKVRTTYAIGDSEDYESFDFSFSIVAEVIGFVSIDVTFLSSIGLNDFVVGTELTENNVIVNGIVSNGEEIALSYENNGYDCEYMETPLVAGQYGITFVLTADSSKYMPFENVISQTRNIKVHEENPSFVEINRGKRNYNVGETFRYSDFEALLNYLIEDDEYFKESTTPTRITYFRADEEIEIADNSVVTSLLVGHITLRVYVGELYTSYIVDINANETQDIYAYDKITHEQVYLGQYDSNYNMGLTLDKSKDSCKIVLFNYVSEELKPNTIVYLPDSDSWWCVFKDTCDFHQNEHENGLWKHEIELVGAFEILTSRDLTNFGANKDRYTLGQLFERVVKMSDYELPITFDFTYIDESEKVGYLKSFENYNPSSAFKEICEGINCIPKMRFERDNNGKLVNAIITPIPKSGIGNTPIDIETFNLVDETKTSQKGNYGTRVVSNVRNLVSKDLVRYPSQGSVYLQSDDSLLTFNNAYIKLPQKADYVDRIEIYGSVRIIFDSEGKQATSYGNSLSHISMVDLLNRFKNVVSSSMRTAIENEFDDIVKFIEDNAKVTLRNNDFIRSQSFNQATHFPDLFDIKISFGSNLDKQQYQDDERHFIYWQQGSDRISNFQFYNNIQSAKGEGLWSLGITIGNYQDYGNGYLTYTLQTGDTLKIAKCMGNGVTDMFSYVVYYRPQVDLKLKVENDREENDSVLFNQNGKLNDPTAICKLINSHADSISSNQISRKAQFYNFFEIPKVGSLVDNHGQLYIINNISIDSMQNDGNENIYFCDISMSKQVACKSIMVSANNNIRDYDTPQQMNLVREQLYRDYYELNYTSEHTEPKYNNDDLFNFGFKQFGSLTNYISFIKTYDSELKYKYYKVETTNLALPKMKVSVLQFIDNNIIGYSKAQTNQFVFNLFNLFTQKDVYNVPISYVDKYGELTSIEILLLDENAYNGALEYYVESIDKKDKISYFGFSPVIIQEIYDYAKPSAKAVISENNYEKDGLEIPKFEFVQQFGNANDIVIGSGILDNDIANDNEFFVYQFHIQDRRISEENAEKPNANISGSANVVNINDYCDIDYDKANNKLVVKFYGNVALNDTNGQKTSSSVLATTLLHKNISIFARKLTKTTGGNYIKQYSKLLFAINDCKVEKNASGEITLYLDNYKLN